MLFIQKLYEDSDINEWGFKNEETRILGLVTCLKFWIEEGKTEIWIKDPESLA